MKECSKSIARRMSNPDFINHYFVGDGVDIGGLPDPLNLYQEQFCQIKSVKTWDLVDGDAQFMEGASDNSYDFVHSSHCLEHLNNPVEGLVNWLRIVRPGGYLIITVPDEDLYEQGIFPSTFNHDHKHTFTIYKKESWSKSSINILDLVRELGIDAELVRIELLRSTYHSKLPRYDQTISPISECGIEVIIRKRKQEEIRLKGGFIKKKDQPDRETRLHFNQYSDDIKSMKSANRKAPPFENDNSLNRDNT